MGLAAYNSTFECGVWCQGDVRVAEHQPKMRFPGGARFSFSVPEKHPKTALKYEDGSSG